MICILSVLTALALLLFADSLMITSRIRHVAVRFPPAKEGTTWLIVGSDSRASLPSGEGGTFGTPGEVPGQRSDVVLVIHVYNSRVSALSIPRDLLVQTGPGSYERLTFTFTNGPQGLVNALCDSLGIPVNRLIVVNFSGFARIVNDVGGVTVNLPYPVRDPMASLDIGRSGAVHLSGTEALGLVRSRTPEWRENGHWVAVPSGSVQRTMWAGRILAAITSAARGLEADPLRLQELAWDASGDLEVSSNVGPLDLAALARQHFVPVPVPAKPLPSSLALGITPATRGAVAAAGYGTRCAA